MSEKPLPRCKALLLCENVTRDEQTGRLTVVGIMDTIWFPEYPATTPQFYVFIQLTGGIGAYKVAIKVRDLADDSVMGGAGSYSIEFKDRAYHDNRVIGFPPFTLPHPGAYEIALLVEDQEFDRQRLDAVLDGRAPTT